MTKAFQSTPPVKAATWLAVRPLGRHQISIHAAREGGDTGRDGMEKTALISIHAAREGGDDKDNSVDKIRCISIHAAREGGDL